MNDDVFDEFNIDQLQGNSSAKNLSHFIQLLEVFKQAQPLIDRNKVKRNTLTNYYTQKGYHEATLFVRVALQLNDLLETERLTIKDMREVSRGMPAEANKIIENFIACQPFIKNKSLGLDEIAEILLTHKKIKPTFFNEKKMTRENVQKADNIQMPSSDVKYSHITYEKKSSRCAIQ